MEELTAATSPSFADIDFISRDSIPLLPHNTCEMDGDSLPSSQSPYFGYIPIGLDIEIDKSVRNSSSPPGSVAGFSYQSWVDKAWDLDRESIAMPDSTVENSFWKLEDNSGGSTFAFMHEESTEFDEALGSFLGLSTPGHDDLSSGSSKVLCQTESNNQCSRESTSGVALSSQSSTESSKEVHNACDIKSNESLSMKNETPDIIITETQSDAVETSLIEQPGPSARPFLDNPIQFHYQNSGATEYLVRLSSNAVQVLMPEWLMLYKEKLELLEQESKLQGSRARIPKRKKEI